MKSLFARRENLVRPCVSDYVRHWTFIEPKAAELSLLPKSVLGDRGVKVESLLEERLAARVMSVKQLLAELRRLTTSHDPSFVEPTLHLGHASDSHYVLLQ